jgi:deazaflavin-dependent oxidoreductase (nitroreductase family)
MSGFNDQVIAEFNQHGGRPGGHFEGAPVLLLHTIGAKTGLERTQPVMFLREGDGPWHVFASYGGGPKDPAWYRNIVANPEFDISVGDGITIQRIPVRARVL